MDPNKALAEILRGNLIADHVEALRQWLGNGGFQPNLETPDDTLHWFQVKLRHYDTPAQLPEDETVRVSANTTGILVLRARNWVPFMTWFQVLHAPGSEEEANELDGTTDDLELVQGEELEAVIESWCDEDSEPSETTRRVKAGLPLDPNDTDDIIEDL